MKNYITILLILTTTLTQAQNLPEAIAQQISAARGGQSASALNWSSYEDEEKATAITNLQVHSQDSLLSVRLKAYDLLYQLSNSSQALSTRQQGVEAFLQGLKDEEQSIQGYVSNRLSAFQKEDFTENMRSQLLAKLNPRPFYYEQLVLLLAHINEQRAISPIINHLRTQSSELSQMERWQAHIALARLGEEPALNFIVRKAQELPVNDDAIYDIYPTLAFTRQKAAVDILIEQVFSDQRNCSAPDTDSNRKITCAYRVLELIAPIIQDFPIPVDTATGDLDVADYEAALKEAREWLRANRNVYELTVD